MDSYGHRLLSRIPPATDPTQVTEAYLKHADGTADEAAQGSFWESRWVGAAFGWLRMDRDGSWVMNA